MRSIEKILKEIEKAEAEKRQCIEDAGLYRTEDGYWSWRNPLLVLKINEAIRHIANLKINLNQERQKRWWKP